MSKIIPVMVHHETGEKAQAAGKKNQEYLKYCMNITKRGVTTGTMPMTSLPKNGQNFMLSLRIFPHIRPHGQRASLSASS